MSAEMKIGGITAHESEFGIRGDFHASGVKDVRHFTKRDPKPETDEHGCPEFNVLEFAGRDGEEFSVFVDTASLASLIEQAQGALDAANE